MKQQNSTKKALLASVIALALCFTMLVGTTFAWFTDVAESQNNVIKTGKLDIDFTWADGAADPDSANTAWTDASTGAIYNSKLWEPGYTDAKHLKIANIGTLALKYELAIIPNGTVSELANVIDVYFVTPATAVARDTVAGLTKVGTLADLINGGIDAGVLAADETTTMTLVLKMQETAGNDYQDKAIGTTFSVQLIATQATAESDSFGNDYDKNAVVADDYAATVEDLKAAIADPEVETIALTGDIDLAELAASTYSLRAANYASGVIAIPAGTTKTINLNGFTLSGTYDKADGNVDMFLVKGSLTVMNGTIEMATVVNQGWGAMSTIFDITAGGVVNVNNAKIVNLGGTDMSFCAHLNNWGTATLNADNSTFIAPYVAVRVFNSGNDMNNVTITNSTLIGGRSFWVHNYTVEDFGGSADKAAKQETLLNINFLTKNDDGTYSFNEAANNVYGGPVRFGFTNSTTAPADAATTQVVIADTEEELVEVLKNNSTNDENTIVILNGDVSTAPAQTAPYGNKYAFALNGGTLDGNGNTVSVDAAGDNYAIMTSGGTIKNLTVDSGFRGILVMYPTSDLYVDNVTVKGDVCYALNTAEGDGTKNLYISNSTLCGWTSIGNTVKSATFTNCTFGQGEYYTNVWGRLVKPYISTVFENCEFNSLLYLDLSALAADGTVVLKNCTVNGVTLTADNWAELIAPEDTCTEGQMTIEGRNGTYMSATNVFDYVVIQ